MPRLLVINPNTSAPITAMLQRHIQSVTGPTMEVQAVTARFGAPYISSEAGYAVASHAVLDAWAATVSEPAHRPDAVLVACFGDPGVFAMREGAGVPVNGLAEAAFSEAAWHGRFAIVTGGERWRPMLSRLASALGHTQTLAGIHTVVPSGAELAADPAGARLLLAEACCHAMERFKVQAVILGGAGLAGMAADIAPMVPVPVIDSVSAGAQWAVDALRRGDRAPPDSTRGFGVAWQNVAWELAALS